ncbi:ATPase, partial [Microbacterium sp. HM58-2]
TSPTSTSRGRTSSPPSRSAAPRSGR